MATYVNVHEQRKQENKKKQQNSSNPSSENVNIHEQRHKENQISALLGNPTSKEEFDERAKKLAEDINTRMQSFNEQYNSFFDNYQSADNINSVSNSLKTEAKELQKMLSKYGVIFEDDYVSETSNWLNSIGSSVDEGVKHWSQWETKDDYDTSVRMNGYSTKYQGMSVEDEAKAIKDLELRYAEASAAGSEEVKALQEELGYITVNSKVSKAGWGKYILDKMHKNAKERREKEEESFGETILRYLSNNGTGAVDTTLPTSLMTQTISDIRADDSYKHPNEDWTEVQERMFGYLYYLSPDQAYKYAEELNYMIAAEKEGKAIEDIQNSATSGFWAGAGHSLGSLGTSYFGLADYLNDIAMASAGRPIAPDGVVSPFEYSQAVQSAITTKLNDMGGTLDEDIPIIGGKGWGDVYGLGMSAAKSVTSAYTLGRGSLISFFGQGAAAGVDDAKSRGATDEQALLFGAASGTAEAAFEMLPIDNLLKAKNIGTKRQILFETLKHAGIEDLEETGTGLANFVSDCIIMGSNSNLSHAVKKYQDEGLSYDKALKKALWDATQDVLWDGISGFLSGIPSGGFSATYQGAKNIYAGSQINKQGDTDAVIKAGLDASPNSQAFKLAEKASDKLTTKGKVPNMLLGALKQTTTEDVINQYRNRETLSEGEIRTKLESKGIDSKKAAEFASIIAKQTSGKKLSEIEKETLKSNEDAQAIANEIATAEAVNNFATRVKLAEIDSLGKPETPNTYDVSKTEGKTLIKDSGAEVEIVDIESIKDGKMILKVKEGTEGAEVKEVNAENITFASNEEALMYEMVTRMETTPETAKEIISSFKPSNFQQASMYFATVPLAYQYGTIGYEAGLKNIALPENQKRIAYNRGRMDAIVRDKANTKPTSKKGSTKASVNKKGIIFEGGYVYDEATVNDLQRESMMGIEVINKMSNLEVHVFESKVVDGNRVAYVNGKLVSAPNGYFTEGNKIYIDINAGNKGEGAMLYTMSHEVTHYIREWNAEGFRELGDFLIEQYGKKGVSVNALLKAQENKIKRRCNEEKLSLPSEAKLADMAYEELVADAMSDMFTDPRAYEKLAKLKQENKTLWKKLGEAIKAVLDKLKTTLGIYKTKNVPVALEASYVRDFSSDVYEKLQDLYIKAFVKADANYKGAGGKIGKTDNSIVSIDADSQSVAPIFSERTWTQSEYVTAREQTAKDISKALGVDIKTAYKYIDDINSIARLIADDRVRLDYEPNLDNKATVLKPNSEYKYSVDMSTLCAKRLLFTGTFDAIQRALPNTVFDSEDIVGLREMMQKKGYEVACGICYVESTRREIGRITQEFIDRYKVAQKNGNPIARINSSGKEVVLKSAGRTFNADKGYTPSLGDLNTTDIDLVKRDHPEVYDAYLAFMNARGQAKPKLLETRAEYKGEILKHFKSKAAVEARNKAGGLRLQSFSDFEIPHLIDMMQVVMDMSRVGLKSQAYTKVPSFAEAFGNTGVKINLSLIAKGDGLDANGNLIFDDVEGINHKEAFRLRDKFSKNVGTILVGKNDAHIIAAMADPRIDYIIPFHKSSWKESLYDALGLTGYGDYTEFQSEKALDKSRKISNFDPSEYWDYSKTGDENAQIYLQKCKDDGRIPKFPQFQSYEGYWKLLIDFKMYDNDGVGSPQEVVRPVFDESVNKEILDKYEGNHRSFPVAKDVVDEFVKQYKDSDIKHSERDNAYMDAVNNGDMETAQRMVDEAAKEAGYTRTIYHGTADKFNVFGFGRAGIYTTDDFDTAKTYGNNVMSLYGKQGSKVLTIDAKGSPHYAIRVSKDELDFFDYPLMRGKELYSTNNISQIAFREGYDVVVIKNVYDNFSMASDNKSNRLGTDIVYKDSNQVKSADPVTYDADGNVIPLSQRFNSENEDIRYSERDDKPNEFNPQGKTLEAQLKEAFDTSASNERRYVYVGNFTKAFTEKLKNHIVIKNYPIVMNYRDAYLSMESKERGKYKGDRINYHNLGVDGLKAALESFEDPEYILLSTKPNKIELILQGEDYKGRQLFSIIEVNTKAQHDRQFLDAHVVTSVYGNNGLKNRIATAKTEGRLIYNKNEELMQGMPQVQYKRDINTNSSYKNTIPNSSDSVKNNSNKLFSERNLAPTFYSKMGKVVEDVKQEKLGASSVIPMLTGKGVKAEEIRWSGIHAFLDGKKSITKQELLDFINGSMLEIGEQMSSDDIDLRYDGSKRAYILYDESGNVVNTFTYNEFMGGYVSENDDEIYTDSVELEDALREEYGSMSSPRWGDYKLDGGSNYREIVFTMPNSSYSNQMMRTHWGEDAEGVLAHARIQDFDVNGKKMLFIEEIQSDYHNEGHQSGYNDIKTDAQVDKLKSIADERFFAVEDYSTEMTGNAGEWETIEKTEKGAKLLREYREAQDTYDSAMNEYVKRIPDAPFKDTYHEFVLKRLLRMAAEQGYDSIGWTPANIQSDRWSDEFAEGYRIEYDQDIPKFLRKYGRQWGATVSRTTLNNKSNRSTYIDNDGKQYQSIREWYDSVMDSYFGKDNHIWSEYLKGRTRVTQTDDTMNIQLTQTGETLNEKLNIVTEPDTVWSMDITDAMKNSVLYEGQALYSERDPNATSNRSLLANALENATTNDIEKNKLKQYKEKIDFINAEERKLADLNRQLKELRFSKGKRTPEKTKQINDLQAEATKTANRISIYDKQLLNLESTTALKNVLEREKAKARKLQKQRDAEILQEQKDKANATIREIMNRNTESRKRAVENRHKSEVKNKIKSFKEKLQGMLLHPTDRRYVPAGLAQAMIDVCEIIDTDTSLYKADGSLNKAQAKRDETKEKLQALKDEYEKLRNFEDPVYSGEFDDAIYSMLTTIKENYEGKSLKEMSVEELDDFYNTLRSIELTLADARKLIGKADAKDVYEAGYAIISEQNAVASKRKKDKRSGITKAKDSLIDLSLSPVRNVERMSGYKDGSMLVELFNDFEVGVRNKNKFVMEAYKDFEAITTGKNAKNYESAIYNAFGDREYTDSKGRKFKVSKMQMMQAILSKDRESTNKMTHIENGGLNFADLKMLQKGKLKEAISAENSHLLPRATEVVEQFRQDLANDTWAQEYMQVARRFFDGKAKEAVNNTMLALKHRIVAKDKNYIPFEVDRNFIVREISAANDIQQTINSYGMLQETKAKAPQPLIITGLNNIIDRHIDQVGNIEGLAIPVRNFNKVWNVHSVEGEPTTVNNIIEQNWGSEGKAFVEQVVQDLQGARKSNMPNWYRTIKSNYIGATFLFNGSVVSKQIGSMFAARSMLDTKPNRVNVAMLGNLLNTMIHYKQIAAEVDKYTASAWMRRQGMSDAEVYTLLTEGRKSKIVKAFNKLPAALNPSKWITAMDSAVALSLWKYAKQDVANKTGLEGEALNKATADFYDTLIENTQSMTDVLHRPEIQKKNDLSSDIFGMFKTDLYQMAGNLQNAMGKFGTNKTKENAKALGKSVYAILSSAMWGQLMTTVFALLRYKVKPYEDDEEDELTVESWLKRQGFALAGDLAGYVIPLFGSEVIGVVENIVYGETEDIADSLALTAVNDLYSTVVNVASDLKDGEEISAETYKKFAIKALQVFGIPANNILRTVDAIRLHAEDIANGEFLSFEAGKKKSKVESLHDAIVSGDEDELEDVKGEYKTEDAYESALKQAIRENNPTLKQAAIDMVNGNFTNKKSAVSKLATELGLSKDFVSEMIDSEYTYFNNKLKKAAEALVAGEKKDYEDIVRELRERYRGIYSQDEIIKAIKEVDLEKDKDTEDDKDEDSSVYSTWMIKEAFDNGDNDTAYEMINDIVTIKTENYIKEGYKKKEAESKAKASVKSTLTSYWKPLFLEAYKNKDSAEQLRIRRILVASGVYGRTSEVMDTTQQWIKDSKKKK
jgi:hypothetical protein